MPINLICWAYDLLLRCTSFVRCRLPLFFHCHCGWNKLTISEFIHWFLCGFKTIYLVKINCSAHKTSHKNRNWPIENKRPENRILSISAHTHTRARVSWQMYAYIALRLPSPIKISAHTVREIEKDLLSINYWWCLINTIVLRSIH